VTVYTDHETRFYKRPLTGRGIDRQADGHLMDATRYLISGRSRIHTNRTPARCPVAFPGLWLWSGSCERKASGGDVKRGGDTVRDSQRSVTSRLLLKSTPEPVSRLTARTLIWGAMPGWPGHQIGLFARTASVRLRR